MILLTFLLLWRCFEVTRDVRENDGLMVKIVAVLIIRKIVVSFLKVLCHISVALQAVCLEAPEMLDVLLAFLQV